jgi:hypothetical protein
MDKQIWNVFQSILVWRDKWIFPQDKYIFLVPCPADKLDYFLISNAGNPNKMNNMQLLTINMKKPTKLSPIYINLQQYSIVICFPNTGILQVKAKTMHCTCISQ